MFANIATIAASCALLVPALAVPAPVHGLAKRCGGWGGCGCSIGFPFATSFTNVFNANNNCAHCNDDTLFVNNKDACSACNNVNNFNNANTIF